MTLSLPLLRQGIQKFQAHPNWPSDFHNSLYASLMENNRKGLESDEFWSGLMNVLTRWKALRPLTKNEALRRIQSARLEIADAASFLLAREARGERPNITDVSWEQAEPLFRAMASVKDNRSPVFPSKACHFLFPAVYPVADRELVQIHKTSYEQYWNQCRQSWAECEEKDALIAELKFRMGGEAIPEYPWATKIFELCYAGAVHD